MSQETENDGFIPPSVNWSASTDKIISDYEYKIIQNIATKTMSASKRKNSPDFTKEELLYLNKKFCENEDDELKVITPTPAITLKKGKTELNIGHAVKLVQKMEEKYPIQKPELRIETTSHLKDSSMTEEKYKHFIGEREVPVKEYYKELANRSSNDNQPTKLLNNMDPSHPSYSPPQSIETKNKNAYEIRSDILSQALSWVQYTQGFKPVPQAPPTEDDVLNVAQKFYKFVENRK